MRFKNRREAGWQLAAKLVVYAARPDVVLLALPRGGVPVACEVARRLAAPLDVFPVRKPGVPQQPELVFGAIASGNIRVLNPSIVASYHLSAQTIETVTRQEQQELERREKTYRAACPSLEPAGKISILVDDGLATGATMRAAQALRQRLPTRLIAAVPVAAEAACQSTRQEVDELVCGTIIFRKPPTTTCGRYWFRPPPTPAANKFSLDPP